MSDLLAGFSTFARHLRIDTKDEGQKHLDLLGSQRRLIGAIQDGIRDGVRTYVVLKARQLGISTVGLALDIFFACKYPGLQGTLVTDTDDNRDVFRSILSGYLEGMPYEYNVPVKTFNRYQLVWRNGSRFVFQVAGSRKKGGLGRGKAINFCHATELSSWGDVEGFASLRSSFSNRYPNRLYLLESTARGYGNLFRDLWIDAQQAVSMRAVFIGWWAREDYRLERDSREYAVYGGEPDAEETEWMEEVSRDYGELIDDRQLAWWRWYAAEIAGRRELAMQEMPWTPDMAFIISGAAFFDSQKLKALWLEAQSAKHPRRLAYDFGADYALSRLEDHPEGELKIWEEPQADGIYVMGADPAHGASEDSDYSALEVFRCYADGMDQVAELRVRGYRTYELAWAIVHLAGHYNARLNLELNGPGLPVWQEILRLQQVGSATAAPNGARDDLTDFLEGVRHYFYRRDDNPSGGGLAFHTKTTYDIKQAYMNGLRDVVERGQLLLRSPELVSELRNIREDGAGHIGGMEGDNDDAVIATALAVLAWQRYELQGLVYGSVMRNGVESANGTPEPMQARIVKDFLRFTVGMGQEDR